MNKTLEPRTSFTSINHSTKPKMTLLLYQNVTYFGIIKVLRVYFNLNASDFRKVTVFLFSTFQTKKASLKYGRWIHHLSKIHHVLI